MGQSLLGLASTPLLSCTINGSYRAMEGSTGWISFAYITGMGGSNLEPPSGDGGGVEEDCLHTTQRWRILIRNPLMI